MTNEPRFGQVDFTDQNLNTTDDVTFNKSSLTELVVGGSASLTSVSTGTADNDKLVTQGYVDDAVAPGANVWNRSVPSGRPVLEPTTLGDDVKYFTALDATYPVRYDLFGNHDSIYELWDCYYEPSDSTIRSSTTTGNYQVYKNSGKYGIAGATGVAVGTQPSFSRYFEIDAGANLVTLNADVDMNGYLYSVSSNIMEIQTQSPNTASTFDLIGNGNFAGIYKATYGGDANASVSIAANAATANMTFGSSITNGLDIAGDTTVNGTITAKNSATSFVDIVPYSDRVEFDFGSASDEVHFNRGTESLEYFFWGIDSVDPMFYMEAGNDVIGFFTDTPSLSHGITFEKNVLIRGVGLECDTQLSVSGTGTFKLPTGGTVNEITNIVNASSTTSQLANAAAIWSAISGVSSFWGRSGTLLSPATVGDSVELTTGTYRLKDTIAGTVAGIYGINLFTESNYDTTTVYMQSSLNSDEAPHVTMAKGRGNHATPTAALLNDNLGIYQFKGHNGSTYADGAEFRIIANENFGSGLGTRYEWWLCKNGTGLLAEMMQLDGTGLTVKGDGVFDTNLKIGDADAADYHLEFGGSSGDGRLTYSSNLGEFELKNQGTGFTSLLIIGGTATAQLYIEDGANSNANVALTASNSSTINMTFGSAITLFDIAESTKISSGTFSLVNGTTINEFSIDGTLAGNSDDAVPTEKAVKTYVDSQNKSYGITTVNAATYDTTSTSHYLAVTYTSTGAVTSLTLKTADSTDGRVIIVKDSARNAGTNSITIDTEGSQTIEGQSTLVINSDGGSASLIYNSSTTNWEVF